MQYLQKPKQFKRSKTGYCRSNLHSFCRLKVNSNVISADPARSSQSHQFWLNQLVGALGRVSGVSGRLVKVNSKGSK